MRELADISVFNSISSNGGSAISVNNGIGDAVSAVFKGITKGIGASASEMLGYADKARRRSRAVGKGVPRNILQHAIDIAGEFHKHKEPMEKLAKRLNLMLVRWKDLDSITGPFWTNYVVPAGRVLTAKDIDDIAATLEGPFSTGITKIDTLVDALEDTRTNFVKVIDDIELKRKQTKKGVTRNWLGMRGKDQTDYNKIESDMFTKGSASTAYRDAIRKLIGSAGAFVDGGNGDKPESIMLVEGEETPIFDTNFKLLLKNNEVWGITPNNGRYHIAGGRDNNSNNNNRKNYNDLLSSYLQTNQYTDGYWGIGNIDVSNGIAEFQRINKNRDGKKNKHNNHKKQYNNDNGHWNFQ